MAFVHSWQKQEKISHEFTNKKCHSSIRGNLIELEKLINQADYERLDIEGLAEYEIKN
jgi:hypothetical protein